MGEVSGAKMAAALELAAEDNRATVSRRRRCCASKPAAYCLQEANLGLAAIADIHAAIVDLRRYTPVVGIIAGTGRLLWRYVYRRRAVQLPYRHS